jgi:hypothetical protein
MTWRDDLKDAIASGDKEQIRKVAEQARNHYVPVAKPKFDYKQLEAEWRQPGEDDE